LYELRMQFLKENILHIDTLPIISEITAHTYLSQAFSLVIYIKCFHVSHIKINCVIYIDAVILCI